MSKYAIKIPFEDGWLFITEGIDLKVVTFDKKWEAENYAKTFKVYKVVEYVEGD